MNFKQKQISCQIDEKLIIIGDSQNDLKKEIIKIVNDNNLSELERKCEIMQREIEQKNEKIFFLNETIKKNSQNYENISKTLYKTIAQLEVEIYLLKKNAFEKKKFLNFYIQLINFSIFQFDKRENKDFSINTEELSEIKINENKLEEELKKYQFFF